MFSCGSQLCRRQLGTRKLVGAAVFFTIALVTLFSPGSKFSYDEITPLYHHLEGNVRKDTCTPQAYSSGAWTYDPRTNATVMVTPEDALPFSGFEKCASSREYYWHLAADKEEQYDRFPGSQSWKWIPGQGCEDITPLSAENLIKQLVEDGGWFLVGDSVTENHFFSLSCILYPHVYATPDYTKGSSFDRAWPQNLYLSHSSPLVTSLKFPKGFALSSTPLVTFRRIDILYSKEELVQLHRSIHPPDQLSNDTPTIFSEEAVWTLPLDDYLTEFLAPLPGANYATMVVNTGGHWTTTLFSQVSSRGIEGVLALFDQAMQEWTKRVQEALSEVNRPNNRFSFLTEGFQTRKRAVVRAYLPGHESCHDFRRPWTEIQPFIWNWYNWGNIQQFNDIFERILSSEEKYPDIHYLSIDRPGRLRPDAHTTGDCLHIMTGAGVLEGWTHYILHFVTQLLRIRE